MISLKPYKPYIGVIGMVIDCSIYCADCIEPQRVACEFPLSEVWLMTLVRALDRGIKREICQACAKRLYHFRRKGMAS